jgi:hypothetical protein
MMSPRDKKAAEMFKCSERERAFFEAGIKMGTIYHQFVGTPVSGTNVKELEGAIERSVMVQPFVESAKINIILGRGAKKDTYDYFSLTGEMIDAVVTIRVGGTAVTAEMRFNEELDYPLMYVSEVSF